MIDVKCLIKRYRWIYIAGIAAVLFAVMMAFSKVDSYLEGRDKVNLILQIKAEDFNFFLFYFKLLLVPATVIAIGFLFTINYYLFLGNFVVLFFYIRIFLTAIFAACVHDGITAYLLLFFLWIPLLLTVVFAYLTYLALLFQLIGYNCDRKRMVPYSCYWNGTKKVFVNTLATVGILVFCYSSIVLIILSLIF